MLNYASIKLTFRNIKVLSLQKGRYTPTIHDCLHVALAFPIPVAQPVLIHSRKQKPHQVFPSERAWVWELGAYGISERCGGAKSPFNSLFQGHSAVGSHDPSVGKWRLLPTQQLVTSVQVGLRPQDSALAPARASEHPHPPDLAHRQHQQKKLGLHLSLPNLTQIHLWDQSCIQKPSRKKFWDMQL